MIIWLVIVIIALTCSVFFALSETSIFSISREKYEALKNDKGRGRKVYEVLMKSNLFLVFLLLGNNFVNIVAISGMEVLFGGVFGSNLTLIFISTTVILVVIGEIMPKVIAVGNYMSVARFVAPIIVVVLKFGDGFFKKIDAFNLYILRMNYRYLLQMPNPFVTSDEYSVAVEEAVANKKIGKSTGEMISSFLDITQASVSKIARNRKEIKIISDFADKNALLPDEVAIFYEENDEIKNLLYRPFDGSVKIFVPEWFPNTKNIGDLHNYFLQTGNDCVLLLDEYGGFYGAASRYDIYKYWKALCRDKAQTLSEITLLGSDELVKYHEWVMPEILDKHAETKTFNGLLCLISGKIPESGEIITQGGFSYQIIEADAKKALKVKIQKNTFFTQT
ncbi:MAG: CNNM domain-containing protein [Chitinivibrionia bacterium]|nr:CNNM domain-containing protein [Chitinivibrionia bacterium]